jgi:hypothetical protein
MTSQDAVTVCSTHDSLTTVSRHAESCPDIFSAPVTQHLILIHEELSKEVVIRGLYRLKDATEEPIGGDTQFVCRLDVVD